MTDIIVDEHKATFDKTKEKIKLNSFDLAVLSYRFKVCDRLSLFLLLVTVV